MTDEPFLTKLCEIARIPLEGLSDDAAIDPTGWESIEVLDVISAIDDVYGTTVPFQALTACRTVGQLRELIRSKAFK
jgi:acyl carrier protein